MNIRDKFLGGDPFAGYVPEFPFDVSWSSGIPTMTGEVFDHVFADKYQRPSLVVEVGTWKGDSALKMADYLAEGGTIVCVDTWLGNQDMHWFPDMHRRNGYPRVYYQFLSNVVLAGKQGVIVPMPITSHVAALLLASWNVKVDAVYVDASHDYHDVRRDLEDYWPLVRDGGVLFGDDYNMHGVSRAVGELSRQVSVEVEALSTSAENDRRLYFVMRKS